MKTNFILKYILDYILSFIFLIILSPFLLFISLLILIIDGAPVFFIQTRAGKKGKPFKLIKFKTITKKNRKYKITWLGKFLRVSRIDELPQLINILKGELSLVGPRPLYIKYIKFYNKVQKTRLNMKPGITGWAQINGDNNLSWQKKFKLDIWYIKNFNLILDFFIIFKTFFLFFKLILDIKKKNMIIENEFKGSYE